MASFAGTMPVEPNSCVLENNIPIMHIHAQNDSIIPYSVQWDWKSWPQVGTMWDIPGLVTTWIDRYNCQDTSQTSTGSSTHIIADTCDDGVRVEHHRLNSGGHGWPAEINGTSTHEVIWNFVSEFTL